MTRTISGASLVVLLALCAGCQSYQLDYGEPAAQFLEADVATSGKSYLGQKITVKGTVTRVDADNPQGASIHLENGIRCNLGKFKAMVESTQPGETVFVDGFLRRCTDGDILLEPAILRDPSAPFSAQQ